MGALLIGLGYWSFHGIRDAIAETRVASLEALHTPSAAWTCGSTNIGRW